MKNIRVLKLIIFPILLSIRDCDVENERLMKADVDGRRKEDRSKRRWMDSVNVDLREKGLSGEETQNRAVWRELFRNIDPHIEVGEDLVEEEDVNEPLAEATWGCAAYRRCCRRCHRHTTGFQTAVDPDKTNLYNDKTTPSDNAALTCTCVNIIKCTRIIHSSGSEV